MNQRTLIYTLLGSVALNFFLLGVTSMHWLSRPKMAERLAPFAHDENVQEYRGPQFLRALVRAAGGPQDERVKELWSGRRQHLGSIRKEIFTSREHVLDALEREPFDRQAVAKALNTALEARQRAEQLANEGVVDLAEKLTPAERADFCRKARSERRKPGGKARPDREQ